MLTIHFECVETCSHYNDTNNFYHSIIRRMLFQKQEILLSWIQQNIDIKFYQRILVKLDWAWLSFLLMVQIVIKCLRTMKYAFMKCNSNIFNAQLL